MTPKIHQISIIDKEVAPTTSCARLYRVAQYLAVVGTHSYRQQKSSPPYNGANFSSSSTHPLLFIEQQAGTDWIVQSRLATALRLLGVIQAELTQEKEISAEAGQHICGSTSNEPAPTRSKSLATNTGKRERAKEHQSNEFKKCGEKSACKKHVKRKRDCSGHYHLLTR